MHSGFEKKMSFQTIPHAILTTWTQLIVSLVSQKLFNYILGETFLRIEIPNPDTFFGSCQY